MKKLIIAAFLLTAPLAACTGPLGTFGMSPQTAGKVQSISRTALDFALNSFDAALYGLDFAMDSGRLQPGSANAKRIAAAGRTVMKFLGVAEAARDLGNAETYEQAFAGAKAALEEFRSLLPVKASMRPVPPLTNGQRAAILDRLVNGTVVPTI